MERKSILELEREYDLELDKIVKTIKKEKVKRVLLQFPDGLKPFSTTIAGEIEKRLDKGVKCIVWLGSCFGGCDVPVQVEKLGIDMIVQFGHSKWKFKKGVEIL